MKKDNQFEIIDDLGKFILCLVNDSPKSSSEIIQAVERQYYGSDTRYVDDISGINCIRFSGDLCRHRNIDS